MKSPRALAARLSGAPIAQAMQTALDSAAASLAEAIRARLATPPGGPHESPWRQTGTLQASIDHSTAPLRAVIGSTSAAAPAQECGTTNIPPRPFLIPEATRAAPAIANSLGVALHAALTRGIRP